MDDSRIDVEFNARLLGTASGWDGEPGNSVWFYDFQPAEGIALGSGDLMVDMEGGWIYLQDAKGEPIGDKLDIPSLLVSIPRIDNT